ncbi:MAG: RNA polymerase factor sigma-32 [Rhodospirillaceae bacterium]|nr:RNA polymerase factor sigma-32 [Rhodospirillaceae bacterium]
MPSGPEAFTKVLRNAPYLSREDELALARRWREQRDEEALHRLVVSYWRLVHSTARRFRRYRLPFEDLVQEGLVGLLQAAERFEPERNLRFSTYAVWWIRCAMQDYVLRNWSIVRVSSTPVQKLLFFKLLGRPHLPDDGGLGELSDEACLRMARAWGVKPALVRMLGDKLVGHDVSLNAALTADGAAIVQDLLVDDGPSPEQSAAQGHAADLRRRLLAEALAELDPRERSIVVERRLREDGATLDQLGRRFGVTKERVRQVEERAIRKMRESIRRRVPDGSDLLAEA